MNKKSLLILSTCFFLVVGCKAKEGPAAPELRLNEEKTGLVWDAVPGADSYFISINGVGSYGIVVPVFNFTTAYGDYEVSIQSVGKNGIKGKPAVFNYSTKQGYLKDFKLECGTFSWSGVGGGEGLSYAIGETSTNFIPFEGNSLAATVTDIYLFRINPGYIEDTHEFFPDDTIIKSFGAPGASSDVVIEAATASSSTVLAEDYSILKYQSNAWAPASTATISLNNVVNEDFTEGNCAEFKFSYQGYWFMYQKEIELSNSYGGFSFAVKSDDYIEFTLSFQVSAHTLIGPIDLCGVYLKYNVKAAPTEWTRYNISFNDENWRINYGGADKTAEEAMRLISLGGYTLSNITDLLPLTDTFQFRLKGDHNLGNYQTCRTYFDDVMLSDHTIEETTIEAIKPALRIRDEYELQTPTHAGHFYLNKFDVTQSYFSLTNFTSGSDYGSRVTPSIDEENNQIVWTHNSGDYVLRFDTLDGGKTITIASIETEDSRPWFNGLTGTAAIMLDDFEKSEYEVGTGIGYDANHAENDRTGLRAAYYCDWYNEGTNTAQSPVGGNNWWLMQSSDYLKLGDEYFCGNHSMDIKNSGNPMRFMTYGLKDGVTEGYKGTKVVFFVKGGTVHDCTFTFRMFSVDQVIPSNQVGDSYSTAIELTIPKDSGWTRYELDLNTSRTYYGFAITTKYKPAYEGENVWGLSAQRILVDNISLIL